VVCLASPDRFGILRASCIDTDELSFHFSNINEAANASRLQTALPDSYADVLLVHLLAKNLPSLQFADGPARQNFRRWQMRFGINVASLVVLLLAALFAARTGVEIYLDKGRMENAAALSSAEKLRFDNLVSSLPAVPVTPDNLRALIARWDDLQKRSPDLAGTLAPISNALQLNPQVELVRIDWRISASPDEIVNSQPYSAAASAAPANSYIVIDIEAKLPGGLGPDRRAQNDIVERFADNLKLDANDNARILQRPFDTDSSKSLKGSSETGSGNQKLNFTARYWRKVLL
jgi:hypothetical protein